MTERPAGLSVRARLTLSYAGFVVLVGIAMFALGFLLLRFVPEGNLFAQSGAFVPRRVDLVEVYVRYASWVLAALAVIGLGGGWIVAGWMLRPLTRITDVARSARDGAFERRIRLGGSRDELTDLADTFDDLLARVQHTLDEQRRFAANASHELRTPHSVIRTMLEVARADPQGRDVDVLLDRLAETNERSIRLTDALLRLSRAGAGATIERTRDDLGELVQAAVDEQRDAAVARGIAVDVAPGSAPVAGDASLLRQLAENLVRNAVVHNLPRGGRIQVSVAAEAGAAVLVVANTGAELDPSAVETFVEPFVRGAGRTRGPADGEGLGLAIVAAIVRAHDGTLSLRPRPGGGLTASVRLPT